eukprot:3102268-Pyramimonas_sp.AAC.2
MCNTRISPRPTYWPTSLSFYSSAFVGSKRFGVLGVARSGAGGRGRRGPPGPGRSTGHEALRAGGSWDDRPPS